MQETMQTQPGPGLDQSQVQVTVHYLPATQPFHHPYPGASVLETVRIDAMQFFGVQDHQDRDTHRFFLEFEAVRVTNTSQTLDGLIEPHRRGAPFNLIEEITAGANRRMPMYE